MSRDRGVGVAVRHRLLRIDGVAGLTVGVFVLLAIDWLPGPLGLPRALLLFTGVANLLYGVFSTWLTSRDPRPMPLIVGLVAANTVWAVVCVLLAAWCWNSATWLGLTHLWLEGAFVGGLACAEWRNRMLLTRRSA